MTEWQALTSLAADLARAAGSLALQQRQAVVVDVTTKSSSTDIVTAADQAAEALITDGLQHHRPDDAIVGEEGTAAEGTTGITWFIDPIDGTTNFYYGLPGWVVSIAAVDETGTAAAAVYDPIADVLYSASRDGGAFRNGTRMHVRTATASLDQALIATGFSYLPDQRRRQAEILLDVVPNVRDIRRSGAAAKDLCLVAEGVYDAYYEAGLNRWDLAAGWLIAVESGARVEFLTPETADRRLLLAAPPHLFEPLAELLDRAGAPLDP
jgi:myo-inositol-1(or 4)-monophosphatase